MPCRSIALSPFEPPLMLSCQPVASRALRELAVPPWGEPHIVDNPIRRRKPAKINITAAGAGAFLQFVDHKIGDNRNPLTQRCPITLDKRRIIADKKPY